MSLPWFRFYIEACSDGKLRRLTPAYRWCWVCVLAMARASPRPGWLLVADAGHGAVPATAKDLADFAALSRANVEGAVQAFLVVGMLELAGLDGGGSAWHVVKWDERQFESDNSTTRTQRHRSKKRKGNVPGNGQESLPGTPPDTDTDTDSERPRARRTYPEEFEACWAAYPPRRNNNKAKALRAWTATVGRGTDPGQLLVAAQHYAIERRGEPETYTMHAATFFGPDEHWRSRLARPTRANGTRPDPQAPRLGEADPCPAGICDGTGYRDDNTRCECNGGTR